MGQKLNPSLTNLRKHINPIVLARKIDLEQVFCKGHLRGNLLLINLGKKGDLVGAWCFKLEVTHLGD